MEEVEEIRICQKRIGNCRESRVCCSPGVMKAAWI